MGKTIQAISLMLANRPGPEHTEEWDKSDKDHDGEINPKMRAGTLVVCPLIALLQWQSEIAKFTQEGSLKVCVVYFVHTVWVDVSLHCFIQSPRVHSDRASVMTRQVLVYHGSNREDVKAELQKVRSTQPFPF